MNDSVRESDKQMAKVAQRQQLVLAILEYPTLQKAAASIGISEVTAWRIRRTPEFKEEFRVARRESALHALGRIQQAASAATTVLLELALDSDTPPATRLQAVCRILDYSKDYVLDDIDERLKRQEQLEANRKK